MLVPSSVDRLRHSTCMCGTKLLSYALENVFDSKVSLEMKPFGFLSHPELFVGYRTRRIDLARL
jgi:hypothetical protein